ncbi:diguanylate cyclase with PAS/PAC sensor [Rhizobium sp. PDO1-076]|nr:diguanylate cyclase with PAS/PAC sensor [Rhizobium sp. PDO1-076]
MTWKKLLSLARRPELSDASTETLSGLYWYVADGEPVPPELDVAPIIIHDIRTVEAHAVLLLPVRPDTAGPGPEQIRALHGQDIYIIAVSQLPVSLALQQQLYAEGADDVHVLEGRVAMFACLARAKRHFERSHGAETKRRDLKAQLDILQDALDHLPTPIYLKNINGRYQACNTAFANLLSRPREEVIGHRLEELAPAETAEKHETSDARLRELGGLMCYETDVCLHDDDQRYVMLHKALVSDEHGKPCGIAGVMIDITERKRLEARLMNAAERDPLTDAFNRRKFFELADQAITDAIRQGERLCVAAIDVDHFKSINDEFGHAEGDITLCSIVDILRAHETEGMIVARAGGEEFFAFFFGAAAARAEEILQAMRTEISHYCQVKTAAGLAGTISVGMACFDPAAENIDRALRRADAALYHAKHNGRNRLSRAR